MTFVIVHGAAESASNWDLVAGELRGRGHGVVAPDLPCEDNTATFEDYADAVVEAIGDRTDLVVVGHSLGGFTAPLVCERVPVEMLVFVAAMIPVPGETAGEWWTTSGYTEAASGVDYGDEIATYLHDVPSDLAVEALRRSRGQSDAPMGKPWPLDAWPDVPTRFLVTTEDRFFPAQWMRGLVRERLGIEPDEIETGHCPYLSRPHELADRLEAYRAKVLV